jgi:hypothetical protein
MANSVGFAVAQRVEYGEYLETREDVYFAQKDSWPVCEKAVKRFIPEFDRWVKDWKFAGDNAEEELEKECGKLSLLAQTWAQENRPWTDISEQAKNLLTGFLVVDGRYIE